jgi:hypothetical protein
VSADELVVVRVETKNAVAAADLVQTLVGRCPVQLSASDDGIWRVQATAPEAIALELVASNPALPRDAQLAVSVKTA